MINTMVQNQIPQGYSSPASGMRIKTLAITLGLLACAAAISLFGYRLHSRRALAERVRHAFATGQHTLARLELQHWLTAEPLSAEAHYYQAWQALIDDQPATAINAIQEAKRLGFDTSLVECLAAIYQARAKRYTIAEPVLQQAFLNHTQPQALVARELARIYLSTYRLDLAAAAIERWRQLDPDNPQPYLWRNEIASRSDSEPSVLIQNYLAALERNPDLDDARLGLADELRKDRRFDEAELEYQTYLKRQPGQPKALIGLGQIAFQQGNLTAALNYYEQALAADPRQPDALRELALADLRMGRFEQARRRFQTLVEIDPFDYEIRYSYAQTLRRLGDEQGFRIHNAAAARLRKENDEITQLRHDLMQHPDDLAKRCAVARWMIQHGHESEGLKWTNEILRVNPNHGPTHALLAEYHASKGNAGLANYHRVLADASQAHHQ